MAALQRRGVQILFAGGFALVFALVLGLWQLTRHDDPPPPAAPHAAPARASAAPAAPPPVSAPRAAVVSRPRPAAPAPVAHVPEPVPAAPGESTVDLKRDANGRLAPLVSLADLRDLLPTLDEPMKNCIAHTAPSATGEASFNFTVTAKNGKLAVESTSVVDEGSLTAYPDLLACLHQAGHMFAVGIADRPISDLGNPMVVRRRIRLENGAVREHTLPDFSYLH